MMPLRGEVLVHDDAAALARAGAEEFAALARAAVAARGRFDVALTGGGSPVELYRALASEAVASLVPWQDVHLFWGDDRVVPPDHPRSNFRLAARLFIARVPIPSENVHRVRGELGAQRAAEAYRRELGEHFAGRPRFDLIHLGIGDDGHVASLFPFDATTLLERARHALPALFRELGEWRVTLSYPILNDARRVEFLLPDPAKASIARVALRGPIDPLRIPAQGVRPATGTLVWRMTNAVRVAIDGGGRGD